MSDTGQAPRRATQRKATLRARLRAARADLTEPVRAAAARRVQAALLAAVADAGYALAGHPVAGHPVAGHPVAGYVPVGSEPGGADLPAVLAGALAPGAGVLLPVLCPDRSLDWVAYRPATGSGTGSATGPDPGRIAALSPTDPPGHRLGAAAIGEVSLVVVPALAVDRRGVRLGRGGGSYDRALALASPDAQVVALLHDGELLDEELPAEPHDRRVSAVITPGLGLVPLPEVAPA